MMAEHLEKILESRGFGNASRQISLLGQPAVKITTVLADEKLIPPGVSKFGGTPHVPANFQWPVSSLGEPLSFLAQIHFAEFIPFQWMGWKVPVPESGVLSFFLDLADTKGNPTAKIFHFADSKSLVRWEDPFALDSPALRLAARGEERIDQKARAFPPRSLAFQQFLSLPTAAESPMNQIGLEPRVSADYKRFACEHNRDGGKHQVLGWSWGENSHPPGQTLLLQLGHDRSLGWSWSEGLPQFFILDEDLANAKFDRITLRFAK